jgi:hypothetical protein
VNSLEYMGRSLSPRAAVRFFAQLSDVVIASGGEPVKIDPRYSVPFFSAAAYMSR